MAAPEIPRIKNAVQKKTGFGRSAALETGQADLIYIQDPDVERLRANLKKTLRK